MAVHPPGGNLPTFEEARHTVERHAASISLPPSQHIKLTEAKGRVLAEVVKADRDIPPFARSTRDGYAVRASDLSAIPTKLQFAGEIRAGEKLERIPHLHAGQAISIMTGAPVPEGADAVVMVEYTTHVESEIEITRSAVAGENIVPRGAEARLDRVLLDRGQRLNESAIALAASAGKSSLEVYKCPRVAILTTGDEIVDVEVTPGPTQIRNSNSHSLAAQIAHAGGDPVTLPIAPDEPKRLRQLIEQGLQSDLLLMTGGVSMGRYDLVEQVLAEMQAEFTFTGAKIQPGRPVVFGRVACAADATAPFKYFFGLPGNPVSTMVTFELFARPMLEALAGISPCRLMFLHAQLKSEIRVKTGLTRFLPAMLTGEFDKSEVELVTWQGSGDIAATARANCYAVVPPDRERIAPGEWVAIMLR